MRLDKYLAEHYFDSRNKAARAIEKGLVSINGRPAKASCEVSEADVIIVREEQVSFVSEGGYKLFKALQDFRRSRRQHGRFYGLSFTGRRRTGIRRRCRRKSLGSPNSRGPARHCKGSRECALSECIRFS